MRRSNHRMAPALVVIAAGVCAALHVGKLPPALSSLQLALELSLVQAGFLLSLVQLAGMVAGIAFGAWADSIGAKRSMILGLAVLALASMLGGFVRTSTPLLILRAFEGFGFLLVVLPAPAMVRRLVPPAHVNQVLGLWGAYMPFGAALGLLVGPAWIDAFGWRSWWWCIAGVSAAMAIALALAVDAPSDAGASSARVGWPARLRTTLARPGPWLAALSFAVYSAQWLAVIGFLPTIYLHAGLSVASIGALTALAAAVNMLGNVAGGHLMQRGAPPATLMMVGFVTMGVCSAAAFAGADGAGLPPLARYLGVLGFSMVGGLIPVALFSTALRVAPDGQTISTTVGWMQQWSAFGQFAGPPLVAWAAARSGGWHWTWVTTGVLSLLGLALSSRIAALLRR